MGLIHFGEKLKELRKEAGLTQKQLALKIGASKSMVSFYELQERMPSPSVLVQLAAVFHVSTDYLLGVDTTERIDVTGLTKDDIKLVADIVESFRRKNENNNRFKSS